MSFKKRYNSLSSETKGCLNVYAILFITIPSLVFNMVTCSRWEDYSVSKQQAIQDSVKIANLEKDVLRATGNAVVHDTVVETETYYLGEEEAIHEIYKRLDKIEQFINDKKQ